MFNFDTANCLLNGAEILRRASFGDIRLVLAHWNTEYVVWRVDAQGNAFWGQYFRTYDEAKQCWRERFAQLDGSY